MQGAVLACYGVMRQRPGCARPTPLATQASCGEWGGGCRARPLGAGGWVAAARGRGGRSEKNCGDSVGASLLGNRGEWELSFFARWLGTSSHAGVVDATLVACSSSIGNASPRPPGGKPCPHARRTSRRLRPRLLGNLTAKQHAAPSAGKSSLCYAAGTTVGCAEGYSATRARRRARTRILTGSSSPNPNVRAWIATPSCAASQWVGDRRLRRSRSPARSPSLNQTKSRMRTAP